MTMTTSTVTHTLITIERVGEDDLLWAWTCSCRRTAGAYDSKDAAWDGHNQHRHGIEPDPTPQPPPARPAFERGQQVSCQACGTTDGPFYRRMRVTERRRVPVGYDCAAHAPAPKEQRFDSALIARINAVFEPESALEDPRFYDRYKSLDTSKMFTELTETERARA